MEMKRLNIEQACNLSRHNFVVDAFVTDDLGIKEPEVIVTVAYRVPLSRIKSNQGWKAVIMDAKKGDDLQHIDIVTESEVRMPDTCSEFDLNSGQLFTSYKGYNKIRQQDYIKKNGKKVLERYKQF